MFGIESKGVLLAYLLCIVSTLICVVYGLITWNRGDEEVEPDDVQWAQEEASIEEEF
ncbi:hypothetical protein STSP2_03433 [Anaerohalosphaera lusitana]|uniref:Uncharacterized protein n=1 Tax=Anaerohalosphaera lusitana TaxID=1936003 RepID=A0A1U9NR16_9BACT|nr:symporter small accessory protein [Anaerohalosphaera lusitana]AQT70227.1 hypothetical protein STSP2_03433 [Anaerohalosphaera lusitana]